MSLIHASKKRYQVYISSHVQIVRFEKQEMLRNWLKKDQENSKERALMEANQFQKTLNPGQKEQAPKTVSKKRPLSEESATDETALSDPKSKSTKIAPVQVFDPIILDIGPS